MLNTCFLLRDWNLGTCSAEGATWLSPNKNLPVCNELPSSIIFHLCCYNLLLEEWNVSCVTPLGEVRSLGLRAYWPTFLRKSPPCAFSPCWWILAMSTAVCWILRGPPKKSLGLGVIYNINIKIFLDSNFGTGTEESMISSIWSLRKQVHRK